MLIPIKTQHLRAPHVGSVAPISRGSAATLLGGTMTIRAIRNTFAGAALFVASVNPTSCPSTTELWQRDSCDPAAYRLAARMVMSGTPTEFVFELRLTNVSSHAVSGCRYIPESVVLRTATGQPLGYTITKRLPEICGSDDEFHLRPGDAIQWVEPMSNAVGIEPIVSGEALLTLVRSSFADPRRDPLCTLNLPVFFEGRTNDLGVPPNPSFLPRNKPRDRMVTSGVRGPCPSPI